MLRDSDSEPLAGLRLLLDKYERLLALSAATPGRTDARRSAMREIATRFPGALREWDQHKGPELERRRDVVAAALGEAERPGSPTPPLELLEVAGEPWLRLGLLVHLGFLRVLALRGWLLENAIARTAVAVDEQVLARCLAWAAEQPLFRSFRRMSGGLPSLSELRDIAVPPSGRLTELVYVRVAAAGGVSVADLKHTLYGDAHH